MNRRGPHRRHRRRTIVVALLSVGVLLVLARTALPGAVEWYANRVLDRAEGYRGSIDNVDVALVAGRYRIEGLRLDSVEEDVQRPLLSVASAELSVEWGALLRGSLVGDLVLEGAEYTIEAAPPADPDAVDQAGGEVDWLERLDELFPLRINRFELRNGMLAFHDPHREPEVDVRIEKIAAVGLNWGNIRDLEERRYATLAVEGRSQDQARLELGLEANPLARSPDFALDIRARRIDLPNINAFLKAYAGFDVSEGQLDLFAEIEAKDGRFSGYVKPLLSELDVLDDGTESLASNWWEGFVGGLAEALENQPEDQQGAKVPVEGEFGAADVEIWSALASVLSNAFLQALPMGLEGAGAGS